MVHIIHAHLFPLPQNARYTTHVMRNKNKKVLVIKVNGYVCNRILRYISGDLAMIRYSYYAPILANIWRISEMIPAKEFSWNISFNH